MSASGRPHWPTPTPPPCAPGLLGTWAGPRPFSGHATLALASASRPRLRPPYHRTTVAHRPTVLVCSPPRLLASSCPPCRPPHQRPGHSVVRREAERPPAGAQPQECRSAAPGVQRAGRPASCLVPPGRRAPGSLGSREDGGAPRPRLEPAGTRARGRHGPQNKLRCAMPMRHGRQLRYGAAALRRTRTRHRVRIRFPTSARAHRAVPLTDHEITTSRAGARLRVRACVRVRGPFRRKREQARTARTESEAPRQLQAAGSGAVQHVHHLAARVSRRRTACRGAARRGRRDGDLRSRRRLPDRRSPTAGELEALAGSRARTIAPRWHYVPTSDFHPLKSR